MFPYQQNVWVVKWENRALTADAFVIFKTDDQGKITGMTMKAISPGTSFGFDFSDLDFRKMP